MKEGQVCQLKVSLLRIKPLIWRRVIISLNSSLNSLHQLIQFAMGWWNYHLHAFEYAEEVFEFDGERPLRKRLSSLGLAEGCELLYTYDFGDNWEHLIKVGSVHNNEIGSHFKAKNRFFTFTFQQVEEDANYVLQLYFPQEQSLPKGKLFKQAKLAQQSII